VIELDTYYADAYVGWGRVLEDARETIENWRLDYNRVRPHSALGYLTPEEFRDRTGYANVESKQRFPLLEWSAVCFRNDGLFC
jgi:hypothetical protein